MVKSQLIASLAVHIPSLTLHDVELSVNHLLDHMTASLTKGERIEIRGFGSMNLHYRKARQAHNPKNGLRVTTIAKFTPHFKPGKALRERVNNSRLHTEIIDPRPLNTEE